MRDWRLLWCHDRICVGQTRTTLVPSRLAHHIRNIRAVICENEHEYHMLLFILTLLPYLISLISMVIYIHRYGQSFLLVSYLLLNSQLSLVIFLLYFYSHKFWSDKELVLFSFCRFSPISLWKISSLVS